MSGVRNPSSPSRNGEVAIRPLIEFKPPKELRGRGEQARPDDCLRPGRRQQESGAVPELISKPKDLFLAYKPGGSPACFRRTGAWDKETGKFIRNGHILQYALWKQKEAQK